MSGPSAYVHSNANNAELSVNIGLIDQMNGDNLTGSYVDITIAKLESIKNQLNAEAESFLEGYGAEAAQDIANNAGNLLVQLANEVLYGADAYSMVSSLTQNKKIKEAELRKLLENQTDPFVQEFLSALKSDMSTGEFATALAKKFSGNSTHINITEAGSQIVKLGTLLDVNKISTSLRKEGEVLLTDQVFKTGKSLVTHKKGTYRNMIKDLLESSNYISKQSYGSAINNFCNKLQSKMLELAPKYIHFMNTANPNELENRIVAFINTLKPILTEALNSKKNKDMYNKTNVAGAIGEEVRASITKAANSVMISFVMGDTNEQEGVERINDILKSRGISSSISEMKSHHQDNKQSMTDLVILNTNNKRIARAQSKNHFVSHFTNNRENKDLIGGFRWKVANNLNILSFIQGLSNTELGINLTQFDMSNITGAMANNLWFQYNDSAYPSEGVQGLKFSKSTPADFQQELEGTLERLLSGQITNLLGVTVLPNTDTIEPNASNIFYLLNGRLTKTSELVQQAIDQLKESENLKLSQQGRMVNVKLDTGGVKGIGPGSGSDSFLVQKLRNPGAALAIGEEKGEEILNNIKINVSLGTSISTLAKSSLIF